MVKINCKKVVAFILALAIIGSMTACGKSEAPSAADNGGSAAAALADLPEEGERIPEEEWVRLEYLRPGTGVYEEDNSLVTREIAARTGVFVQRITVPEDKYTVLMASGDFEADMVYIRKVNTKEVVDGKLLMEIDDLVDQYGPNLKKYADHVLTNFREYRSNDTGKLYFVPTHVDRTSEDAGIARQFYVAPFIRWDYYEELGFPPITNEDELLNVLKQMQDKHPETADGKKTYAISRPTGDDPIWMYQCMYQAVHGQSNVNNWFVTSGLNDEIVGNVLDKEYILWKALKFYNKADRLGIFDPESFTQKWANAEEKAKNGQMFFEEYGGSNYNKSLSETVGENAGFQPIHTAFPYFRNESGSISKYGWDGGLNITSSCENPEAAMRFINFMFSPEGARLAYSGIEGIHWEYDADGKPVPTEDTLKNRGNKEWDAINGLGLFDGEVGLGYGVKAEDGYAVKLDVTEAVAVLNNTPLDTKYSEQFDATYPGAVPYKLAEQGLTKTQEIDDSIAGFMGTRPDDITRIMTKGYDYIHKLIPRAIMAKDDAEFDGIVSEAIETLESYGVDQVITWTVDEFNKAKALANS